MEHYQLPPQMSALLLFGCCVLQESLLHHSRWFPSTSVMTAERIRAMLLASVTKLRCTDKKVLLEDSQNLEVFGINM